MIGFSKINGIGNSFIFFDEFYQNLTFLKKPERIKLLCSTAHGIGADGVVFVKNPKSNQNHCCMEIYNSDGSEAEMCGNAIRGVAMFFARRYSGLTEIKIETRSGLKEVIFVRDEDSASYYCVQMGKPVFDLEATGELLPASARTPLHFKNMIFEPVYVNMGNPHGVIFLDTPITHDFIKEAGAWLETHSNHPKRINIEFVNLISKYEAIVNVWERGCGITMACGTGACAVLAAGMKKNMLHNAVKIRMPGGTLELEQRLQNNIIYMTGAVSEVAVGILAPKLEERLKKL